MKKIVHVLIDEQWNEGYSYQENNLANKHKEMGYDVYVITTQFHKKNNGTIELIEPKQYINPEGINITVLPCNVTNPIALILYADKSCGLYNRLEEISPDIIFLHEFKSRDIRHIIRYKKNHDVKLFVDCHSDFYNMHLEKFKNRIKCRLIKSRCQSLFEVADKIWGTLPWRVDFLKQIYKAPEYKTDLLIMGADENYILGREKRIIRKSLCNKYNIPEDAYIIATGGRINKAKKQDLLINAVSQLYEQKVYLVIFGTPTEDMKEFIEKNSNLCNIRNIGWVDKNTSYDVLLGCDLAFFPGTHSILWEQCVASATPSVFKFWEGMKHVNVNGNAILLEKVNVESIKTTILEHLFTSKYKVMLEHAKIVADQFFLKNIAKKAIDEYNL